MPRQKRKAPRKPRSAAMVGMSSLRSSCLGSARSSLARSSAMRALSWTVPIDAVAVDQSVRGRRKGSPTTVPLPRRHTSAPGSNMRRSRAARSRWRWSSGYPVSSTWNPRSSTNPSTVSLRTRPPTPSLASRTVLVMPFDSRTRAATRPARPAPTMTTSADSGSGALSVTCRECHAAPAPAKNDGTRSRHAGAPPGPRAGP